MSALDTFSWDTLTRAEARKLRVAAAARERAVNVRYEAGAATDEEFAAAMHLEEDLHVYALTGAKPGTYRFLSKHRGQAVGPWTY